MSDIKNLVNRLNDEAKGEVYWLGACDELQINILENKLNFFLPNELKEFILFVCVAEELLCLFS